MAILRRALCLIATLAALLCSAAASDADTVPAGFWQDGRLHIFVHLSEAPGSGVEPRLQLGPTALTLAAEGPLARMSDADTPVSYLLLVDRSNSMGGLDWNVTAFARRLARQEARFSLASFGVDFRLEAEDCDGDGLLQVLKALSYEEEGTDLPSAVVAAMDYLVSRPREPGELVNLVVITDGVTEAVEDGEALEMARYQVEEDPSVLVHTVGLATGRQVSPEALEALSALGSGAHLTVGSGGVSADSAARTVAQTVDLLWTTSFSVSLPEDLRLDDAALCLFRAGENEPYLRLSIPAVPLLAAGEAPAVPTVVPSVQPQPTPVPTASPPAPTMTAALVPDAVGDLGTAEPGGGTLCLDPVWRLGGLGLVSALAAAVVYLVLRRQQRAFSDTVPSGAIRLHLEVAEGHCVQEGEELYLFQELTIGRDRRCDLVWRARSLPPLAGRVFRKDGLVFLEGLDPRCQVRLEGMRLYGPSRLRSGDEITMGPVRFRLRF